MSIRRRVSSSHNIGALDTFVADADTVAAIRLRVSLPLQLFQVNSLLSPNLANQHLLLDRPLGSHQ